MIQSEKLTDWQKRKLEMINKGYGLNAGRHEFTAREWREINDLLGRGLIRKSSPVPWNKKGAFVAL